MNSNIGALFKQHKIIWNENLLKNEVKSSLSKKRAKHIYVSLFHVFF